MQNAPAIGDYMRAVADGRLATRRGLALSAEDRLRREVIERLMCDLRVDLGEVAARHGVAGAAFRRELEALAPLADDGLVRVMGERISVPEDRRALVRNVAAAFDAYLVPAGEVRHTTAV